MNDPSDERAAAALDAYLTEHYTGQEPDRAALLAAHPGLTTALSAAERLGVFHASPVPAPPPEVFGKYRLLGELGRGGMGVVFRAQQTDLDRPVALKMILSSHLASEQQVRRFHVEAKTAARVQHPNIVRVYESGAVAGQHFISMELVDGAALNDVLTRVAYPPVKAAELLLPVARAVAHLHERGLIHRDLKPGNILIDAIGRPLLTDFGLAKALEGDEKITTSGAIVGTPAYMPPEQAGGAEQLGPWSDVYALGAILYELLTGRTPFVGATPPAVLIQVLEREPPLPRTLRPGLPRPLELIALKCLEKDPAQRYPHAGALADDLERFCRGESVAAQPRTPWRRLVVWARREPGLASRSAWLFACAAITQVRYYLPPPVPLDTHLLVIGLLAVWWGVSWLCQRGLDANRLGGRVPEFWSAADVLLYSLLLGLIDKVDTLLLAGYPVLIAAAGLWSRAGPVWWTAGLSALAYLGLLAATTPASLADNPQHPLIFLVMLGTTGAVVANQVQRLRLLSRFADRERG